MMIEASLATHPPRVAALGRVVPQLAKQVDRLHVYANCFGPDSRELDFLEGYENVVLYLARSKSKPLGFGDLGDIGKFWHQGEAGSIQFRCDDDILYPDDYVERMVEAIERTHRSAVVGVHGVRLLKPFWSYFRDRDVSHFSASLNVDTPCHLLGTGTIAYPVELAPITVDDFYTRNMADVYFARWCQRREVPLVSIRRPVDWLRPIETEGPSIYDQSKKDAAKGNDLVSMTIRSHFDWKVFEPKNRSAT